MLIATGPFTPALPHEVEIEVRSSVVKDRHFCFQADTR